MEDLKILVDGKEYNVKVEELDNKLRVHFDGEVFEVETKSAIQEQLTEEIREKEVKGGKSIIRAPLPGIVFAMIMLGLVVLFLFLTTVSMVATTSCMLLPSIS